MGKTNSTVVPARKPRNPRLTPSQVELLSDIATRSEVYLRSWSRWGKTGQCLARLGLATLRYDGGYYDTTITITEAGRKEAERRGLVPPSTQESAPTTP